MEKIIPDGDAQKNGTPILFFRRQLLSYSNIILKSKL